MNILHLAAKKKFRFNSPVGALSVEQLFDLPLRAKGGLDLDGVAKLASKELKAVTEESFVDAPAAGKADLEAKLEIVKFVIADKQADAEEAKNREARAATKAKLLNALDHRETAELSKKSAAQLRKELAAL